MTERTIDTAIWSDSWFGELDAPAKLLFVYLWTNPRCSSAGIYEISPRTIAFDTSLPLESVPELLESLAPKVAWYPDLNIIWVKNFLRYQMRSPLFLVSVTKALRNIPEDAQADFLLYNRELLGSSPNISPSLTRRECVLIRDQFRCQYCGNEISQDVEFEVDHVVPLARGGRDNYSNIVASCRSCNRAKRDRLPVEAAMPEPTPTMYHAAQAKFALRQSPALREQWLAVFPQRLNDVGPMLANVGQLPPNISPTSPTSEQIRKRPDKEQKKIRDTISSNDTPQKKRKRTPEKAFEDYKEKLRLDFQDIDYPLELQRFHAYWDGHDAKHTLKNPSLGLFNWMTNARRFQQQRQPQGNHSAAPMESAFAHLHVIESGPT